MPMSIAGGPDIPTSTLTGPDVAVVNYVVRLATPAAALLPSVRRAVDAVDPKLALAQVRTLQNILDGASAQMAFTMALIVIAGVMALLLGVIGIYGAMSYIVSQRTGEIGVRLALGAEPGSVARMIVRQGGVVALVGVAVGLAAAVGGRRLIEPQLSRRPGLRRCGSSSRSRSDRGRRNGSRPGRRRSGRTARRVRRGHAPHA